MGWWSLVGAGGPVIGVSLGSPIIAAFGWRALFWFQLVLIVLAFIVVVILLPRRRGLDHEEAAKKAEAREEFRQMDWIGSWSLSLAVTALMLGLSVGPSLGWTSAATLGVVRGFGAAARPPSCTGSATRRIRSSPHIIFDGEIS